MKISWTDGEENKEVLYRVREEWSILHRIKRSKANNQEG